MTLKHKEMPEIVRIELANTCNYSCPQCRHSSPEKREMYKNVLGEKKRETKRQKSIERAIQVQDEIRNKIGDIDLIQELRKWRDERK